MLLIKFLLNTIQNLGLFFLQNPERIHSLHLFPDIPSDVQ